MILGLLDYGLSNLRSVQKAFEHLGVSTTLIDHPAAIHHADKLILPGVGAFGAGMAGLQQRGLIEPIQSAVGAGIPLLGICLGMQLLFESSEESPGVAGLSLLPGPVHRFPNNGLTVPHIGWNQLDLTQEHPLLAGTPAGAYAYFVHSYYCQPADPALTLATTDYGHPFAAIVGRAHVYGIQFHPEKSQSTGLRLLQNFATL
jgi:imidazole glycerol-phosphate synthase subunit HisH